MDLLVLVLQTHTLINKLPLPRDPEFFRSNTVHRMYSKNAFQESWMTLSFQERKLRPESPHGIHGSCSYPAGLLLPPPQPSVSMSMAQTHT